MTAMPLQGTTIFCFAASYAAALGLELWRLRRPGPASRALMLAFAFAGLMAHSFYLGYHALPLSGEPSSLLFLAWVLAVYYFIGSFHHRNQAWGVFVLPVVVGLVVVAWLVPGVEETTPLEFSKLRLWAWAHFLLLVLGAVGLSVAFAASVMYLVQASRLRHKSFPGEGLRLLSLERLEAVNRRAINLAFPLFTGGLLIGVLLLWTTRQISWFDPKVLATGLLWLMFGLLFYLRYALHLRGRRVAWGTVVAFGCLVLAFVINYVWPSEHHFGGGL
jgi:ABC-type transport system involved in cytochrome c biogenesis permease subunit